MPSSDLAFGPKPEPWVIRALAALLVAYVAELVLRNLGVPVYALAWLPFGEGFEPWQPVLRFLVQGDDSAALFNVLFGLLILYFGLPALEATLERATWVRAVAWGALGGTITPLALDAVGWVQRGGTMGWVLLAGAVFIVFGLALPHAVVRLFFVIELRARWLVWAALALAIAGVVLSPSLHTAEALGTWLGVVGWWFGAGPGARRRQLLKKADGIERELRRFQVIEGGRNRPPSEDVH